MKSKKTKIAYIGVGRAGCTVVSKFHKTELENQVKTIIASGYSSTLEKHNADLKLYIPGVEGVLRPGLTPGPAREGVIEIYDQFIEALKQGLVH